MRRLCRFARWCLAVQEVARLRRVECVMRRLCRFARWCLAAQEVVRLWRVVCAMRRLCRFRRGYCCVAAITARRATTHASRALPRPTATLLLALRAITSPNGDTTSRRDITARSARLLLYIRIPYLTEDVVIETFVLIFHCCICCLIGSCLRWRDETCASCS